MHRSSRRALLALAAVLAGGAAVVGGTMLDLGPASEAAPAPSDGTLASAEALERLHRLPPVTDRVFAWTDVHYRGAEAQRRYAIDCMARQGFHYAPPATPAAGPGKDEDQRPRPFGLESAPSAAPPTRAPRGETPPKPGSPEASPAYAKALFGDESKRVTAVGAKGMKVSRPGDGCLADAEKRVLGDGRMRWLQVRIMLFEAQEQARKDVEQDPAFRNATGRWRQCMERAGFPGQRDPLGLPRTPSGDMVKADLRCKSETGYLTTAYTRLAAVQQRWLDANPAVVKDWTALLARQDKTSREVLAGKT